MMSDYAKSAVLVLCAAFFLCRAAFPAAPKVDFHQPPQQAPATPGQTRQQAYLRFIEAQRLKHEARRLNSQRLLDQAIEAYKDAIWLDPVAAEPHVDLGELYFFYQSRRDLAEREAQAAIRLDNNSVGAHLLLARLSIASLRLESNPSQTQLERAAREYEIVAKLDPNNAEAWALLAQLYGMKNDTARQTQALERWASAPLPADTAFYRWLLNGGDPSPDQAFAQLAPLYLSQGRQREALDAARRAYVLNPDASEYGRNLIGVLRAASSSVAEELRIYARLAKAAPSPTLQIGYGAALLRAGRAQEALEKLYEFAKADPGNSSLIALLSLAQRRANQRQAAIETLKMGLARVESGPRLNLQLDLAQTYEELERPDEALAVYEQLFEQFISKGNASEQNADLLGHVLTRLVRVYRRTGNQAKLQSVFARARRVLDEGNTVLDTLTIEGLREEGKHREALNLTRAATRRAPGDRTLRFTEALILSDLREFQESSELLRGMLNGGPEHATEDAGVYLLLSNVQMQAGQLREAEASTRKALELNPGDSDTLIQLSSLQDKANRPQEAEQTLRELLQREPDNATALNNLGYLLLERGVRLPEAHKLIEQAVAIDPLNGSFLDSLGWAHYKLGNLEKAREQLEKASRYSRRNATVHEHLGDVLRELGRVGEARRNWEKALEYSSENEEIIRIKDKLKAAR